MTSHPRRLAATLAIIVALLLALPCGALADGDKLTERADTTWSILPDEGVARVSTAATLQNAKKPVKRTRYYFSEWGPLWIPARATMVEFSGRGVTARLAETSDGWDKYLVGYPRLWYKQKQKLAFSFDLPTVSSGVDEYIRLEDAYLHFCWYGNGADIGSVKAILPAGFEPITYQGPKPSVVQNADGVVLKAPVKREPSDFFACTEAFAPGRYQNTYLTDDSGNGLVIVMAWPGDAAWDDFVTSEVNAARPWLEERLGTPLPLPVLSFREVSTQGRHNGMSDRMPLDGIIGIIENDLVPGVIAERLARTWFGPDQISEPWLAEGLAMWTGRAAVGEDCPEPVVPAVAPDDPVITEDGVVAPTAPDLDDWIEPVFGVADAVDWQRSRYQSAVTCGIVATAAEAIGAEAMTTIVAGLLASPTPAGVADWLVELALASDADTVAVVRAAIAEAGITT